MNNQRRKEISSIVSELQGLSAQFDELKERIEAVRDEEQEYFDNMPESFQQGDKGSMAEEAISNLDSAVDAFEIDFDEIISSLENAAQ